MFAVICISSNIAFMWLGQDSTDEVIIGSGNGFVVPGNNPLPQPVLTQIYVTIWHD